MIITIDGPIATGKSSIAKKLSEQIGYIFFDTGAMYRCLTYALIKHKVNIDHLEELKKFLETFNFHIKIHHLERRYIVEDEDVTNQIRGKEVTALVSKVAALGAVRDKLVALQRELSLGVNAVFEGRDMGTIVFPNAHLKIFLTGRPEVRARRRFEELRAKFPEETKNLTVEETLEDLLQRDTYDSTREISPLQKAPDAFEVDTSDLSLEEIVDRILDIKASLKAHKISNGLNYNSSHDNISL